MAGTEYIVVGHFKYVDDVVRAIARMKEIGAEEKLEYYAPLPLHELEDEMYKGKKRSPVRRFTLLGGLTGVCGAFLMTCWMSTDYPLRVSAKPLISIPAFVVIGFECTILLGSLFTLISMFHFARIPHLFSTPGYRKKFSEGTIGLIARVPKDRTEVIEGEMKTLGASEVEVQYVR